MSTTTTGASTTLAPAGAADQRPWATYERISKTRSGNVRAGDGRGGAVGEDAQHDENVAYVRELHPGAAIADFRDNKSAWAVDTVRDDWERMLAGILAGNFRGVVAWCADRYTRQPMQQEMLIAACEATGTQLHTVMGKWHADPTMLRIEGALAAKESKVKSDRLKLKHGTLAAEGRPHGGQRAYGYTISRDALVPEEAAHVRWAAEQVLAGRSIRGITAELTERGAVTTTGKLWRPSNLGVYLRRPMLAGKRVVGGEIVGDATWPALLDLGTWTAVRTLLENPERRVSKSAARVYLLTGIATCASCGRTLRGRSNASQDAPAAYFCDAGQGCAYRRADLVDAQVRAMVVQRLTQLDASGALVAPETDSELAAAVIEQRRTDTQSQLDGMARMLLHGEIKAATLAAAQEEADTILAECDRQLAELELAKREPVAILQGLAGMENAGELFDASSLETRRAVVKRLCTVVIAAQGQGGRTYDPALVQVSWRS